jgi:hypothetical protein
MNRPHVETELKPGLFFSPGFYMGYWQACIVGNFKPEIIWGHTKLQKHREMYAGAIMAAAQTKASGVKHYVGLPDDEPSDVDVVRLVEHTMNSGRVGSGIERLNVQLTECNFERGETFLDQFRNKNKPAYANIIVAVFVSNGYDTSDFASNFSVIQSLGKIYPSEVLTVESVDVVNGLRVPAGTFGLSRIYPKPGSSVVNLDDPEAFFMEPSVFSKTRKQVSVEWEDLGSLTLLPPTI